MKVDTSQERAIGLFETTFRSRTAYADPFNDVDLDVIFTLGDHEWRVPTFWRGGRRWRGLRLHTKRNDMGLSAKTEETCSATD